MRLTWGIFILLFGLCGCASFERGGLRLLSQAEARSLTANHTLPKGARLGPVIPGLRDGAIPQGLTYDAEKKDFLTSHYFDDGSPSCVVLIDAETGRAGNTFWLKEPDGTPHKGHVGGIAIDGENLWVASDKHLYRFPRPKFRAAAGAEWLRALERVDAAAMGRVSFCAAGEGKIWAGEFAWGKKYSTHANHHLKARDGETQRAWLCGYDAGKGFDTPAAILSIPDKVQGVAFTADHIFLSVSYGRRNRSTIRVYENPCSAAPHAFVETAGGNNVPLWFLDGKNRIREIDLPPMAENVTLVDGELAVLFESGADKYRWRGRGPVDQLLLLALPELEVMAP